MERLDNTHVVVTRPRAQSHDINKTLQRAGAIVSLFPVIEIQPLPGTLVQSVDDTAILIFVSRNAVAGGLAALHQAGVTVKDNHSLVAVGPATAQAVEEATGKGVHVPDEDFSSEGLVNMPLLTTVAGKQIVVFCGEQSRPLLGDTLVARGANLTMAPVYRRVQPRADIKQFAQLLRQHRPDFVMFTSVESAANFKSMIGEQFSELAASVNIVVAGHRVAAACRRMGYLGLCKIAASAQDADMISAINGGIDAAQP